MQYLVYIVNKVVSIVITNKLEADYETKKAQGVEVFSTREFWDASKDDHIICIK